MFDGFIDKANLAKKVAEICMGFGVVRMKLNGPADLGDSFLAIAALEHRDAEHVNRRREIFIAGEDLAVDSLGFAESSGPVVRNRDVHRLCESDWLIRLHESYSKVFPPFTEIFWPVI